MLRKPVRVSSICIYVGRGLGKQDMEVKGKYKGTNNWDGVLEQDKLASVEKNANQWSTVNHKAQLSDLFKVLRNLVVYKILFSTLAPYYRK